VVTRLERKYAAFDGLNLSFETLEGLVKHNGPLVGALSHEARPGEHRILLGEIARAGLTEPLRLNAYASAEAQAAAVADDIAYVNHDIDDALRAGLLQLDTLADAPLVGPYVARAQATGADAGRLIYEVNRRLITVMIEDVAGAARARLQQLAPVSSEGISSAGHAVVTFSDALTAELVALKAHLFERVYRHEKVMRVMRDAESLVADLFGHYMRSDEGLPERWAQSVAGLDAAARAAVIGDFVAGMTDRYAMVAHRHLFDHTPELR
jgi:dGTPase